MIIKWGVTNFRSIREANLDLAPLTIFTGVTGSGKSSFLDSIVMIAQSIDKEQITLNGNYIKLGNFKENYYNNDPLNTNTIKIDFESEKRIYDNDDHLCIISHKEGELEKAPYIQGVSSKIKPKENGDFNQSTEEEESSDRYDNIYIAEDEDIYNDEEIPQEKSDFFSILLKCNSDKDDLLDVKVLEGQFDFNKNKPGEIESFGLTYKERAKLLWDCFRSYFSPLNFRYLEPFRNPLKPLKQESDIEKEYVNSDGSNTFAVLFNWSNNKKVIDCRSPDDNCEMEYDNKKMYPFKDVLISWLKYFDLSDTFNVDQKEDKYNLSLYINSKPYDLPRLGTAVSQVLPIFVMCLTAPSNSTIVIQEPEAHFHPKMQSHLADFFIAMALTGRQCIIETHSEYIIEQLRYRIILKSENKLKPLHKLTKLFFINKKDGVSHFNDIEINEYAALDEWPEDFFDESHKISRKIMKEAIRKRKAKKQND